MWDEMGGVGGGGHNGKQQQQYYQALLWKFSKGNTSSQFQKQLWRSCLNLTIHFISVLITTLNFFSYDINSTMALDFLLSLHWSHWHWQ